MNQGKGQSKCRSFSVSAAKKRLRHKHNQGNQQVGSCVLPVARNSRRGRRRQHRIMPGSRKCRVPSNRRTGKEISRQTATRKDLQFKTKLKPCPKSLKKSQLSVELQLAIAGGNIVAVVGKGVFGERFENHGNGERLRAPMRQIPE